MAARAHAAAPLRPNKTVFSCFSCLKTVCDCSSPSRFCNSRRTYSREFLFDICRTLLTDTNPADVEMLGDCGLLRRPTQPPTPTPAPSPQWRRHGRNMRKQKRGKRGGIRARLAASPLRPAIPTITLANVRSLDNKMDYIRSLRTTSKNASECCAFVFVETWLNDSVPDCAIQLARLTCFRADRELVEGGKTRGGGLCVYICDDWCRDATVVGKHCSTLGEVLIIKCRPFYLPREFTAILLAAVYIPPSSTNNRSEALNELYQHISEQQTAHPDAFLILAGDFNHANPRSVFPQLHGHVNFPTRGTNTLDNVYTTHKGAYKALPLPHLGASDHITVMLMPAYRPLVKVSGPTKKKIRVWPEGSSEALQDCFSTTDWSMFRQAATYDDTTDLQEYTETVTAYMRKCMEDVTVSRTITIRANQKPWMTGEVHRLLKARDAAFRAGDEVRLKTARANLSRGIRIAKRQYSRRIADHFSNSRDTRNLWRGIQTITDYKPSPQTCDNSPSLLNELNDFFARFEAENNTLAQKIPLPSNDQVLTLSPDSVRRSLRRTNARKASGPDGIPGRVLRDCAEELTDVFTDIFNTSLSQAVVPTCLKATTIIPVPKKSSPTCYNDYRPVALTPIIMKCFERLVMHHIKSSLPSTLDPYQFAYRSKRSTDDAISIALHTALTHLETKDPHVRMLFIDFSSAFNTIIPQQLILKLVQLGLDTSLCNWLLDFLTGRPQAVRVGSNTSSTITLNTGAPKDVC